MMNPVMINPDPLPSVSSAGGGISQVYHVPDIEKEVEEARFQQQQSKLDAVFGKIAVAADLATPRPPGETLPGQSGVVLNRKAFTVAFFATAGASLVNMLLFLIWLLTSHKFPWFIYPLFGSVQVLGMIYIGFSNVANKALVLHLFFSATTNLIILSTYIFAFTPHPWFIYVLLPSVSVATFHALVGEYWKTEHKWFNVHLWCIFVPLNVLLFIVWTSTTPESPWFIYPFFSTSFPLVLHFFLDHYSTFTHKWLLAHASLSGLFNVFIFLIWYSSDPVFPWFIFVWLFMMIPLSLHSYTILHPYARRSIEILSRESGWDLPSNRADGGAPQLEIMHDAKGAIIDDDALSVEPQLLNFRQTGGASQSFGEQPETDVLAAAYRS